MEAVTKVITSVGRALEFALTGQSDYKVTLSEFAEARTIDGTVQCRLVYDELKPYLAQNFGISLVWPTLVELKHPPPRNWKGNFYHSEGNLARYMPQEMGEKRVHQISIAPGLPRPRFRALLGHEMTHAFQREHRLLERNRALREGMARWIEYHLLKEKFPKEAQRLLKLRSFTFGKAVNTIIEYEKVHGTPDTLQWLVEFERTEV